MEGEGHAFKNKRILSGNIPPAPAATAAAPGAAANMAEHIKGSALSPRSCSGLYSSAPPARARGQMAAADTRGQDRRSHDRRPGSGCRVITTRWGDSALSSGGQIMSHSARQIWLHREIIPLD